MTTTFDATADDLPGIVDIYNHAIDHTTAVWTDVRVDIAERSEWMTGRQAQGWPVIVTRGDDDQVTGFASFAQWRPLVGYRSTVEHSVYVHERCRQHGLGRALLSALIDRAANLGVRSMIGGIEATNAASLRLHERLGFVEVGRLPAVGVKFDAPLDLVFVQLQLAPRAN